MGESMAAVPKLRFPTFWLVLPLPALRFVWFCDRWPPSARGGRRVLRDLCKNDEIGSNPALQIQWFWKRRPYKNSDLLVPGITKIVKTTLQALRFVCFLDRLVRISFDLRKPYLKIPCFAEAGSKIIHILLGRQSKKHAKRNTWTVVFIIFVMSSTSESLFLYSQCFQNFCICNAGLVGFAQVP